MQYRVELERKKSVDEFQNSRQRVGYVRASTEQQAMKEAARRCPEFVAVLARKV